MFKKILIANRGEIACRVMATAKRLGVRTVAVYSDADVNGRHVALADEAVKLGPPAASESYLLGDKIIAAAKRTGAEAIHPGYGFLSENPEFVEAVEAAGLVFIGPSVKAIQAMGLKDAAKALMVEAGVPVVPGYHGVNQDPDFLAAEAEKIGYPALIKARAGGGGKGMRLVDTPAEFKTALEGARREGQSSFGDPACLIEKYITHPRHIEVQVFGDTHGNVVHLFERDCSLQRRHQKVIEEAPAPDMPERVRAAMGQAAVDAAKAVNYSGAGTVEFIVDGSGPLREDGFWFMEMNTRLQVEHPVSEAITGLDFVELQLRVAAGEALPVSQADLSIKGWAFEARVYAEDVPKGFLPATGHLDHVTFPDAVQFSLGDVRVDSGVGQGDEISPWYDPMIAKIITHGPTRLAALGALKCALETTQITGVVTNLDFLSALAGHSGFARGEVDTGLIPRDLETLVDVSVPSHLVVAVAALGALKLLEPKDGADPWQSLVGWRQWTQAKQTATLVHNGQRLEVHVIQQGDGEFQVAWDGDALSLHASPHGSGQVRVTLGDHQLVLGLVREPTRISVFHAGRSFGLTLPDPLVDQGGDEVGGDTLVAPMPGLVCSVMAAAGDQVATGDPLMVLEAMKMEHTLTAPRDGTIAEVLVADADQVTDGMLLLKLEPKDD